jgi:hypothetical protein
MMNLTNEQAESSFALTVFLRSLYFKCVPRLAFLGCIKAFLLSLSLCGVCGEAKTPNVILLMADDLGWSDTGFNGNTVVQTPALDEMANNGLVFDRFYAAAPVCSPTRGSCLTGRHPYRYGIPQPMRGIFLRKNGPWPNC